MRDEKEKKVIWALVDEIRKSPQKTILCSRIRGESGYLKKNADISDDDEIFAGMKRLKNWITSRFGKEFYLSITTGDDRLFYIGHDYPEARTKEVVVVMVKDYLKKNDIREAGVSEIDSFMKESHGIELAEFCGAADPAKWLEQNFPELIVIGKKIRLKAENSVPVMMTNPEQEMFSALVLSEGFNKKAKDVCEKLGSSLSVLDVRSRVAYAFAKTLIQEDCRQEEYNGKQIFVFPVSLEEGNTKTVYCILMENDFSAEEATQHWCFYDFIVYPDSDNTDPVYGWLHTKMENISGNGISITGLKKNADAIVALKQDIIRRVEQLIEDLYNGVRPELAVGKDIVEYEKLWAAFADKWSVYFNESLESNFSLDEVYGKLSESNMARSFYSEVIRTFAEYLQSVDGILRNYLKLEAPTVAEKDRENICGKEEQEEQNDIALLRERIDFYSVFRDMVREGDPVKKIELCMQLRESLGFREEQNVYQIVIDISTIKDEDSALLDKIDDVKSYLERCIAEMSSNASKNRPRKDITADYLLDMRINDVARLTSQWIDIITSVLPEDNRFVGVIKNSTQNDNGKNEKINSNTPYGVGSRLYQKFGNESQLAEKYFILGSVFDKANCIPALLCIFRESGDFDKFLSVWKQLGGQAYATADDAIFFSKSLLAAGHIGELVSFLQSVLKSKTELRMNPAFSELIDQCVDAGADIPEAFRMWCKNTETDGNAFENAIASNSLGEIFALLDDSDSLKALGYTEDDIENIKIKLRADFPGGISNYAKGMRIYLVQGNQNRTAEKYFWLAALETQNQAALLRLFDIYFGSEDYQSVNWLVSFMNTPVEQTQHYRFSYARSLSVCNEHSLLISFAEKYPDVLYDAEICASITDAADSADTKYNWRLIAEQKPAVEAACPFEEALAAGNRELMRSYLEDNSQMEIWGYSQELQSEINEKLQSDALFGVDQSSVYSRIWDIQQNLHGFCENYLYDFIDSNHLWFLSKLSSVLFLSQRYEELILFVNSEKNRQCDEQTMLNYLWSLLHTSRYDELIKAAGENISVVAKAADFQLRLEAAFEKCGRMQEFEELLAKMHVVSRNAFENCLINYDAATLHSFVSDRERLKNLGYSEEQIDWFSACYSKPFDKSNDAFAVACRIRTFLGDSRALQFFCDIEPTDARAAKVLFDIYCKNKRFDDVCFLYRRNSEEIWNDHYYKLYINALYRASDPENFEALVSVIDGWSAEEKSGTETLWHHLTALIGSQQSLTRIEMDEEMLLEKDDAVKAELLKRCFDIAWNHGAEFRENIVSFAAELLDAFYDKIPFEMRKCIASINGHLTEEEDGSEWISFIRKLDSSRILFVLNSVYGYAFGNEKEKQSFLKALIEALKAAEPEDIAAGSMHEYFSAVQVCRPEADAEICEYDEYVLRLFMFALDKCHTLQDEAERIDMCSLLSKVDLSAVPTESMIQLMDSVTTYCKSAESLNKNDPIMVMGIDLVLEAEKRLENAADKEELNSFTAVAKSLSAQLAARIESAIKEYSYLPNDANWEHFSTCFESSLFPQEMEVNISDAVLSGLQNSGVSADNFALLYVLPERIRMAIQPEKLKDALISFIRSIAEDAPEGGEIKAIESVLSCGVLSAEDIMEISAALVDKKLLSRPAVFKSMRDYCGSLGAKMEYELYKMLLKEGTDENDSAEIMNFSEEILACAHALPEDTLSAPEDLELIYRSVCKQNTRENLSFLRTLYGNAGLTEQTEILSVLLQLSDDETAEEGVCAVKEMFDKRTVEWIELYAKWWEPLVSLSENEAQAQKRLLYLSGDAKLEEGTKVSLIKLLMSNIHDTSYLKVCINSSLDFTAAAKSKIQYLIVSAGASVYQIVAAIKNLFAEKEAELAVSLMRKLMGISIPNSSVIGQMLGEVYTAENVRLYDVLKKITPEIYGWIVRMNNEDPQGTWKNYSRAVEIAGLTKTEMVLFETVEADFFLNQPGFCAVMISELIKQERYEEAARWHEEAYKRNKHQYLEIEADVLENCLGASELSYMDQLLLGSIPAMGNNRTLEDYGKLVFTACNDGKEEECLSVLRRLYHYEGDDRVLLLSLMNLLVSQGMQEEQFGDFYEYSMRLLQAESGKPAEDKAAYIFTAADVCCPEAVVREKKWVEILRETMSHNQDSFNELLINLQHFRDNCRKFIDEGGTPERLLCAVMGRWEIDNSFVALFEKRSELEETLIDMNKASFISACISSAVRKEIDETALTTMLEFAGNQTSSLICDVCDKISDRRAEKDKLLGWLNNPMDVPGVVNYVFRAIMDDESEPNENILTLFFSAVSYTYEKYKANVFGIKEYVENYYAEVKTEVVSVLIQLNYISTGRPPLPRDCANQRDYMMLINAAEYHIRHPNENASEAQKQTYKILNEDYALLGKIMVGQLNAKELGDIPLAKLINLTILLCQSENAYEDLHVIMSFCPAKWKICLRCVQELMQGCPSNVLYVMEKDSFWNEHEGCAVYVAKLAAKFLEYDSAQKDQRKKLSAENRRKKRASGWGYFRKEDIRTVNEKIDRACAGVRFWSMGRNPKNISLFRSDIDAYVAEMENEDLQKKQRGASQKDAAAEALANRESAEAGDVGKNDYVGLLDYRNLTYVNKALADWKERKDAGNPDAVSSEQAETDELCEQIHDKLDNINDTEVRLNCIMLGLLLFRQNCEGELNDIVTEEALDILEEVSKCISDNIRYRLPTNHISVAVFNTLCSAKDWESLLACCKPWLLFLSRQIGDVNKRQSYVSHIKFVQKIGDMLAEPMTVTETYEYIEKCIKECRAKQSNLDRALKQTLINFLNQELVRLSNQANITLEIYDRKYDFISDNVTGMVRNLGKKQVTDVAVELRIDDVCVRRCTMAKLDYESMVPFSLHFEYDDEVETIDCKVCIQYTTTEGSKETFSRDCKLQAKPEGRVKYGYDFFNTGSPVENDSYVEREQLQDKLEIWYSARKSPSELPSLAVYGMRRMGKSSLLRWLKKHIEENFGDKVITSFINLENVPKNISSLTERVQYCLVEKTLESFASVFSGEEWEAFREDWMKPIPSGDNFDWICKFCRELKSFLPDEKQFFLIIDEVEGLYMNNRKSIAGNVLEKDMSLSEDADSDVPVDLTGQTNFWDTLSVVTQDKTYGITMVLCGADPFTNTVMAGDNLTQFFQRIEKLSIGRMTSGEIREALQKLEDTSDIVYHRDAIDYLWTLTAGLPWHSKRIINTAVEKFLIDERRAEIYPYDVLAGANEIFSSNLDVSDNSMGMWATGADEKIFLSLLAEATVSASTWVSGSVLWEGFKAQIADGDAADRFSEVLKILTEGRQMILKRENEFDEEFRFGSELNRLFARNQKYIPQFISK